MEVTVYINGHKLSPDNDDYVLDGDQVKVATDVWQKFLTKDGEVRLIIFGPEPGHRRWNKAFDEALLAGRPVTYNGGIVTIPLPSQPAP